MIPFYVYYSMFGFQRIGDLAWAAGDMQGARLPAGRHVGPHHAERRRPAARGRPQPHPGQHHPELHQLRPDLRARGRRHHARRPEAHGRAPGKRLLLPDAAQRELRHARPAARHGRTDHQGHVPVQAGAALKKGAPAVQLLGSGTILRESFVAQELLEKDWGVAASVWSCPSFKRADARRPGGGALEPAAPHGNAAQRSWRSSSARPKAR